MDATREVFEIPAQNMERLEARIAQLARKQAKLAARGPLADTTPIGIERLGTVIKPPSQSGDYWTPGPDRVYYECRVTGAAPHLDGWVFLATLQHEDAGTILRTVPTAEIRRGELDRFRDVEPHCEHCRTRRYRKDTYVVRSADGEVRQVGRNCLAAYLGGANPKGVAALAELLLTVRSVCSEAGEETWFDDGALLASVRQFLIYTAASISLYGWVSRSEARDDYTKIATSDRVWEMLFPETSQQARREAEEFRSKIDDSHHALADAVLNRVQVELADDSRLSDYEHNLRVALSSATVSQKSAGIVASAIRWHQRALDEENKREVMNTAAPLPEGKGVVISGVIISTKEQDGYYGTTWKMLVQDDRGFRVWGTIPKALLDRDVGDRVAFKASVERSRSDASFGFFKRPRVVRV